MGGNAPFLIFEAAGTSAAVERAMGAKMRNIGEACASVNQLLVHELVAEEFGKRFSTKLDKQVLGDCLEKG